MKISLDRLKRAPNRFYESFLIENLIGTIGQVNGVFFTSYLLFLNLEVREMATLIGFLGLGQMVQILSTTWHRVFKDKKRSIFIFRISRSALLLMTGLVPLIFDSRYYYSAFFGMILLSAFLLNSIGGAFLEWNDSVIDSRRRGSYYGFRNVLLNASFIVTSIIFGFLLDNFGQSYWLYVSVLSLPIILSAADWWILRDIPFPIQEKEVNDSILKTMFVPLKDRRYQKFVLFSVLWTIALGLGRPLLNVYAIKQLGYSYSIVAFAGSAAAFLKVFSGISFGKTIDRFGAYRIVKICGFLFGFFNMMYIFLGTTTQILYTLIIIFNGIVMIGFNIGLFNYNITLAEGNRMNEYLSIAAFFSGISAFLSTVFSGYVVELFKNINITIVTLTLNSYQCLFMISSAFHVIAIVYFSKNMKEDCSIKSI